MQKPTVLPAPVDPFTWRLFEPDDAPALQALARALEESRFPVAAQVLRAGVQQAVAGGDEVPALIVRRAGAAPVGFFWLSDRIGGAVRLTCIDAAGAAAPEIEAALLDWSEAAARGEALEFSSEILHPGQEAQLAARGLQADMVEEVMWRSLLAQPLPQAALTGGLRLQPWSAALAGRFFEVYQAAFRERPGFPGWTQAQWVDWAAGGEDFCAQASLLVCAGERPLAFLVSDRFGRQGWISQMGVAPAARGRGLAQALLAEAMRRLAAIGCSDAYLDVNVNNPRAARVCQAGIRDGPSTRAVPQRVAAAGTAQFKDGVT